MSKEGYKPSEEEVQKAEDSMSERQEKFSISREKLLSRAESLGVSKEALLKAELDSDENGWYLVINGHTIRASALHKVSVDERLVIDRDDRIRLSALLNTFIYLRSLGPDTEREAGYYKHGADTDDNNDSLEVQAAIKDIFSKDKAEN